MTLDELPGASECGLQPGEDGAVPAFVWHREVDKLGL